MASEGIEGIESSEPPNPKGNQKDNSQVQIIEKESTQKQKIEKNSSTKKRIGFDFKFQQLPLKLKGKKKTENTEQSGDGNNNVNINNNEKDLDFLEKLREQLIKTPTVPDFICDRIKSNIKHQKRQNRTALYQSDCQKIVTYKQFLSQIELIAKKKKLFEKLLSSSAPEQKKSSKDPNFKEAEISGHFLQNQTQKNLKDLKKGPKKPKFNQKIGFFLPSYYFVPSLILGCLKIGIRVIFLDPLISTNKLKRQIETSRISVILTVEDLLFKIERIVDQKYNKNKTTISKVIYFKKENILGEQKEQNFEEDEGEEGKEGDEELEDLEENNQDKSESSDLGSEKNDTSENGENKDSIPKNDSLENLTEENENNLEEENDNNMIQDKMLLMKERFKNLYGIDIIDGEPLFFEEFEEEGKQVQEEEIEIQSKEISTFLDHKHDLIKEDKAENELINLKKSKESALVFFSCGKKILFSHKNIIASILQSFDEDDEGYDIFLKNNSQNQNNQNNQNNQQISQNQPQFQQNQEQQHQQQHQHQNQHHNRKKIPSKVVAFNDINLISIYCLTSVFFKTIIQHGTIVIFGNPYFVQKNEFNNHHPQNPNFGKIVAKRDLDIIEIFKTIDYFKVKDLHTTPDTIQKILNCNEIFERKLGESLQNIISTNTFLSEELKISCERKFMKTFNTPNSGFNFELLHWKQKKKKRKPLLIKTSYGVTECCSLISKQTRKMSKLMLQNNNVSAIGCKVKGMRMKIVNNLLMFKGPSVGKQMFLNNRSEQNITKIDDNNWVNTKDKGYLFKNQIILEREKVKEVIKHKGYSINELELEKLIKEIPFVEEVAIVGEPHKEFGEVANAYVVLKKSKKEKKEKKGLKNNKKNEKENNNFELNVIEKKQSISSENINVKNTENINEEEIEIKIEKEFKKMNSENDLIKDNHNNKNTFVENNKKNTVSVEEEIKNDFTFQENEEEEKEEEIVDDVDELVFLEEEKQYNDEENLDYDDDYEIEQEKVELLTEQSNKNKTKQIQDFVKKFGSSFESIEKIKFVKSLPKEKIKFKYKLLSKEREKPKKGGYINSIINMCNSSFGAGILGLPFAYSNLGLTTSIIATCFYAFISGLAQKIIVDAALKCKKFSYQTVVQHYLGFFIFSLLTFMIITLCYGVCISYTIIIGNSFSPIVSSILKVISNIFADNQDITQFITHVDVIFSNRYFLMITVAFLIFFPLSLFKEMRKLSFFSTFALIAVIYVVMFLIISFLISLFNGTNGIGSAVYLFNPGLNKLHIPVCFISFPLITSAFSNPSVVVPTVGELKKRNKHKGTIIIVASSLICLIVYLSVGISGYLLFGSNTKDDFLLGFDNSNVGATFGRVAVGILAIVSFPVIQFVGRLAIKSMLSIKIITKPLQMMLWFLNDSLKENIVHLLLTFIPFLIVLFFAITIPQIGIIMGFVGSVSSTSCIFIFPGIVAWFVYRSWKGKLITFILVPLGFIQMVLGLTNCVTNLL